MAKADFHHSEKFITKPCNCHPETCACGGFQIKQNPNYERCTHSSIHESVDGLFRCDYCLEPVDWIDKNIIKG